LYKILLTGQDPRLLATRAALLKKIGAHVVSCNESETLKFLESETPNLVVLCHSLSVEAAERIADKVHERRKGARALMLVSKVNPERLQRDAKFDAMAFPEPTQLIRRTTELLQGLPNYHLEEIVDGRQRRAGL
jgi:CheY-like chemotaxis protein